ncbi:hypothetical protein AAE478_009008 [Parahypoxylon ruwenzoriense]
MESKAFDIIIEDPNIRVLVIEAGEDLTADARANVPAMGVTLVDTSADWDFQTVPQIASSAGRVLGGSSVLNSHTFTPTSKANVDAWAGLGNSGWDWASFSKSIESSYTLKGSPWKDSARGPLQLSVPSEDTEWPRTWRHAISKLGYPVSMDPFSGQLLGALITPESVHPDTKQRSFPLLAKISRFGQTSADKIIFDKPQGTSPDGRQGMPVATGVQYTKDGKTTFVKAEKEVILSAGALNSPRILKLSGIGDSNLLKSLGIDVVMHNPYVGENLQNHTIATMKYKVIPQEGFQTIDGVIRQDPNALAAAMESYTKDHAGPLSRSNADTVAQLPFPNIGSLDGSCELDRILGDPTFAAIDQGKTTDAFAKAHASYVHSILASPNESSAQYMTCPGFAAFAPDGKRTPIPPGIESYFTVALLLAHPLSRGSVHIKSSSTSPPDLTLDPRYLSHPLDVEMMARHVQQAEKIMTSEPFAEHIDLTGSRNLAAPPYGDLADLDNARAFVRTSAVGAHHYTGTCSMMTREIGGVVDAQLRVHGCKNLRVCDASIIPFTPSASPQATIYGVAEHGAAIIKSTL